MDRPGRKPLRTAGVTAAALLALLVAGRLTRSGLEPGGPGPPATGPPATTTNPARNPVLAAVDVGPGPPGRLAFGAGAVWAVADAGMVVRIDPARNQVAAAVRVAAPGGPRAVVAGAGAVWVAVASPGTLVRVDPASDRVTASVRLGRPLHDPVGLAATGRAVWVTCCGREVNGRRTGKLLRVDTRTLGVTPVELPREPLGVAAGARQLWVSATDGSAVLVDPGTSRVAGVHAGVPSSGPAQDVAVGAGGVWLAYPGGSLVARLDPEHPDVAARIPVDAATLVAVGGGAVWVVATNDQGVVAIDPTGNLAEGGFPLAAVRDVRALVFGAGSLWVAQGSSRVVRVDPTKLQP